MEMRFQSRRPSSPIVFVFGEEKEGVLSANANIDRPQRTLERPRTTEPDPLMSPVNVSFEPNTSNPKYTGHNQSFSQRDAVW